MVWQREIKGFSCNRGGDDNGSLKDNIISS